LEIYRSYISSTSYEIIFKDILH